MLVQHFLPPSSTTTINNSSFSSSSPSPSSLMKNKKAPILSPFFNSESTGFQPTTDESICMGYNEKIKTHLSAWPRKLTSVMEIHRQRFSQLNPRFKQQQQQQQQQRITTTLQPVQQSVLCPVILPSASRPQPRQQARSKQQQQQQQQPSQTHLPPAQLPRRSNTAHIKQQQQQPTVEPNNQYITLANLTKLLHVLQTQEKINDNETSTETSASTTNSARQRVQQHLQETATRWWKPIRSSDSQPSVLAPSSIHTYGRPPTPTQLLSSDLLQQHHQQHQQQQRQESDNLPLLTIVSNSTRQLKIPSNSGHPPSKYDESESSTEIQTTIISSIVQIPKSSNIKRTRQEPLIMQARGMHLRSHDHHHYYNNPNNLNFLQQQRLIRQT